MSYIEMRGVTKIFNKGKSNEVAALRGVDLYIEKGESVAVMGVSGSGKSTLLNIMGTLDIPTEGSYTVDGVDVFAMSSAEKAKFRNEKIGFALQDFGLLDTETAEYNIRLPLYFTQNKVKDAKRIVNEIADTSALDRTTANEIVGLLLGLQKEGKTVIMVTHDAALAARFDRTLKISDGIIM